LCAAHSFWEIANSHAQQQSRNLLELLRIFLDTRHLGLELLASLLRISPLILEECISSQRIGWHEDELDSWIGKLPKGGAI